MRDLWRLLLLASVGLVRLTAQETGGVAGLVISTWDGKPLGGVTVVVRGTTLAGQTDSTGRYELKAVQPGDQVLRFTKGGYAGATVTDVRVLPGQTTTVNGNLRPEFFELDEFEVTAEEFNEQTSQIMEERSEASGLLDSIGSDQFARVGASDAADIVSKVPGITVADAKKKDGKRKQTAVEKLPGATAPADILAAYKLGEWNDFVVVAKGNHLQHFLNGKLTADVIDTDATLGAKDGVIAFQLHTGPPMTVQFKDVQLKTLP